jgi:succinate dehydrogenase / fumarate reductase cytochrome b subunit
LKVNILSSTIAQKAIVGLSGLMLCGFLVIHLLGNLLLYAPANEYEAYNHYAHALHANPLLPVAEVVLLALFVAHVVLTVMLVTRNARSRPERYAVQRSKRGKSSAVAHNVMHLTGFVVFAFVVLHLLDFRFAVRYANDPGMNRAERAIMVLHDPLSASLYALGSLLLGYHLYHGVNSAFETLGAGNSRVTPYLRRLGAVFALVVALGFASFPVWANFILK